MPVCMGYVKSNDAAIEVINISFTKIFKNIHTYQAGNSFEGWCRKIVVNSSLDYLRANERWLHAEDIETCPQAHSFTESCLEYLYAEDLLKLFRRLTPRLRSVANLYIVEGYSHKEIAKKLNISVGTSKWSLNKARQRLQGWIREFYPLKKSI